MPDLRPSSPLSCGPTLFWAPSPIAWQAMHLLKAVLPVAASCASALEAAAIDAITTSALRVSFLIGHTLLRVGDGPQPFVAWDACGGQAMKCVAASPLHFAGWLTFAWRAALAIYPKPSRRA